MESHEISARTTVRVPDGSGSFPPARRSKLETFGAVLAKAARVTAAVLPAVGPVVDAIAGAVDRNALARIGGTSETLRYLELQRAIEEETRMFETVSNVMKARHDAAMSSIRNLKS